jgi:CXXX repeat modification system protein
MPKKANSAKTAKSDPRMVGRVTPAERDEMQTLFERKNGLVELVAALRENDNMPAGDAFYEKLVADMGRTTTRFQAWWKEKGKLYGWEASPTGHWTIDFDTCEIYLNE